MKLVFCGTPQFAVPALERLVSGGFDVLLVVSQPDRRKGRGMEMTAPPVKQTAHALSLPVVQPDKIRSNPDFQRRLGSLNPDAIIVVAYGRIIPTWMLELPKLGNINVHASLLPKYRGAAPIQWAIANGERVTGVTTMRIDEGLDTGAYRIETGASDRTRGHCRHAFPSAGRRWSRAAGRNSSRPGDRDCAATSTRDRTSYAGAVVEERRRHDRLRKQFNRHLQPLARLSAVARRLYTFSRQESEDRCRATVASRTKYCNRRASRERRPSLCRMRQ